MHFAEAITAFLDHQKGTLERAGSTAYGSSLRLNLLLEWTTRQGVRDTTQLTGGLLERFARECFPTKPEEAARLGRKPLAERTANQYKSQIRVFCSWLAEEGLLGADQAPQRKLILKDKPKPARKKRFTHREEIHHYAAKAREWHPRDQAWVYFQHFMGRRMGELRTMRVRDLDLTPRPGYPFGLFVYDDPKTRRYDRKGQVEPEFAPIAARWLSEYAELIGRPLEPDDYLVPSIDQAPAAHIKGVRLPLVVVPDRPVGRSSVSELLKRAGVPGSHSLRRGTAVSLTRRHDIRAAQAQLGHASQQTTELYQDLDVEMEDFGEKLAKEAGLGAAESAPEAPEREPEGAGVISLADRRRRRLSAS